MELYVSGRLNIKLTRDLRAQAVKRDTLVDLIAMASSIAF